MRNINRILPFILFCSTFNVYGQRHFFVENKTILNCNASVINFKGSDSLTIRNNIFWEVVSDSLKIDGNYYYPFIFSKESPLDSIGYIRYSQKKILILPIEDPQCFKEQILFCFSKRDRIIKLSNIMHLSGVSIKLNRKYFSSFYNENIYVFKFFYDLPPTSNLIDEIHIGLKAGIIKALLITHFGKLKLECNPGINLR